MTIRCEETGKMQPWRGRRSAVAAAIQLAEQELSAGPQQRGLFVSLVAAFDCFAAAVDPSGLQL